MPDVLVFFLQFRFIPDNSIIAFILPDGGLPASMAADLLSAEAFNAMDYCC